MQTAHRLIFAILGYRKAKEQRDFIDLCIGIVLYSAALEIAQAFAACRRRTRQIAAGWGCERKVAQEMDMESLEDLRKSIDNIDNAILAMLAERFKVTNRVGHYKASHNLPARDMDREALQHARIQEMSRQYGLDPQLASSILDQVIAKVVANHEQIARPC